MRRENKYRTNKTVRFCQIHVQTSLRSYFSEQLCIDKRNCWKVMDLLQKYLQSPDYSNKIVVRRNYSFYQYNGYKSILRENPPKHLSFASRPDFIYQPYVNFIKVNQEMFGLVLHYGWKFLQYKNNLELLLDVESQNISVTLIYFHDSPQHFYRSDLSYARIHACGGHFAGYNTVCLGDYCSFGPRIRGEQTSDSRINQVLFIAKQTGKPMRYSGCSCGSWKRPTKSDRHQYKAGRSKLKIQRRNKHALTKQAKIAQILF